MTGPPTRHRELVLLLLVLQVALGLVGSALSLPDNTLASNGRWISTKTTTARSLIGAHSYVNGTQALAGGTLNLGAWHGFQEIIHREALDPDELEFDLWLDPRSYLLALFDVEPEEGFSAVRFGVHHRRAGSSSWLTATSTGEFTSQGRLRRVRIESRQWVRVRLLFSDGSLTLFLEGDERARLELPSRGGAFFGFRGGRHRALVDNIVARRQGRVVFTEDFEPPSAVSRAALFTLAGLAGNLLLFVALRSRSGVSDRRLGMAFAMVNLLVLVMAGLWLGYGTYRGRRYPAEQRSTRQQGDQLLRAEAKRISQGVLERYGARPTAGTERILFLGSSQTWGSGARSEDETFVRVIEEMLNGAAPAGRRYECINAGVAGATSKIIRRFYRRKWLALSPAVVVINLSSNDKDPRSFEDNLAEMVRLSVEAGVTPLLIQEANSPERFEKGLDQRHAVVARVGASWGAPVVDMYHHLQARQGDGLLWWDNVHLTSFGQRLFAERVYDELIAGSL